MPAVGQLVDNVSIPADPFSPDVTHHLCTFSDGAKLLVYSRTTGAYYALRNSSGVWQAPVSLLASPLSSYSANAIVQVGDTVTVFYATATAGSNNAALAYSAGAVNVTTSGGGAIAGTTAFDVAWNSTTGYWYVASFGPSPFGGYIFVVTTYLPGFPPFTTQRAVNATTTGITRLHLAAASATSSTIYLTVGDNTAGQTTVYPIVVGAGGAFTIGAAETAYHSSCEHAVEFDVNGNLDLILYDPAVNALLDVKRTGTATYAAAVTLYSAPAIGTSIPATAYNNSTGALSVFFETAANQPNDELYLAQRTSGNWVTATLAVGGDGNGYHAASTGRYVDGVNRDVTYVYGMNGSYSIYHFQLGTGSAPNTPVITAPSAGNGGSASPVSSWNYTNPIPADLQGAYELLFTRYSDNVVMWDSGWVASAASSGIAYSGTALVYGTQYQAQVRVKDAQLGSASAYSTPVVFTATRPGVATITNVLDNGVNVAAGGDITSAIATLTYSWSQPDGNTDVSYQLLLYLDDGATLVNNTPLSTLTPAVVSGASYTAPAWSIAGGANPAINNLTYYRFQIRAIDSQGGVALSPQYRIRTNWTPPPVPYDIGVRPNSDTGVVTLSWVIASSVASVNVFMRPTGTTIWQSIEPSGPASSPIHVFPPPGIPYDYGFQSIGTTGILSPIAMERAITLPLKLGYYTAWLRDTTAPLTAAVPLGIPGQALSSNAWTQAEDKSSFVPQGLSKPKTDYGPTNWQMLKGAKYLIFAQDGTGASAINGKSVIAAMQAMYDTRNTLQYCDNEGRVYFVRMGAFSAPRADDAINNLATLDLEETITPLTILIA